MTRRTVSLFSFSVALPASFLPVLSFGGEGVDANGFLVHTVTSPYQSGETQIRVLLPDERPPGKRFPVLYVLPVEAGNGGSET